ncbi:hypothetical protein [Streptomyces sp. SD15]
MTGDQTTALNLADEADQSAQRLPAGPQQCALYRIGIRNALGTPAEGISYADSITPAQLPTAERRVRFCTDAVRMWHQLDNPRATYAALRGISPVTGCTGKHGADLVIPPSCAGQPGPASGNAVRTADSSAVSVFGRDLPELRREQTRSARERPPDAPRPPRRR